MIVISGSGQLCITSSGSGITRSDEVADFAGGVRLDPSYAQVQRTEGERVPSGVYFPRLVAYITVYNVEFKEDLFNYLWGITANSSDTLSDSLTASTSYTILKSSVPQAIEVMCRGKDVILQKMIEISAVKAYCMSLPEYVPVHGLIRIPYLSFMCIDDGSGNVVKWNIQN